MEREKVCQYCHKPFSAKRIDAMYCSRSCAQMGYRRKAKPETYGKVVPVYFELDADEYAQLLHAAQDANMDPNEYARHLLFSTHDYGDYIHLFFKQHEYDRWIEKALRHSGGKNATDMVMGWVKDRIFEEIDKGNIPL